MTPIATVLYEDVGKADPEAERSYRTKIHEQWEGIEKIPGTYPFTLERSVERFRLNRFLHELIRMSYLQSLS
jgi:gallate dioxygenase